MDTRITELFSRAVQKGYAAGYQAGYAAALNEPQVRLAKVALEQAHLEAQLDTLAEQEPDLTTLEDADLVRLISYRGYQEQERELADKAFQVLEQRYGVELFSRLGIA